MYPRWTVRMDSDATRTCFFPWWVPVHHVASLRRPRTNRTVHQRYRLFLQKRRTSTRAQPATVPRTATKFNLKLATSKALLDAAEIIFLGHKISLKGVRPDPGKVEATKEMSMPQDVSRLRSLLGALSYYGLQLPKMAARTRPLNSLLRKGVKFEFSPHHECIVRQMLDELSSPNVLAFPDFEAAISGSRKFRLITDASADGLGVVIKQQQPDGSIRPLRYLSRTTLDNERKWSISELECAAIVWAIKRDRPMFSKLRQPPTASKPRKFVGQEQSGLEMV